MEYRVPRPSFLRKGNATQGSPISCTLYLSFLLYRIGGETTLDRLRAPTSPGLVPGLETSPVHPLGHTPAPPTQTALTKTLLGFNLLQDRAWSFPGLSRCLVTIIPVESYWQATL